MSNTTSSAKPFCSSNNLWHFPTLHCSVADILGTPTVWVPEGKASLPQTQQHEAWELLGDYGPHSKHHVCSHSLQSAPPGWLVCLENQVPVEEGAEGWPGSSISRGHLSIGRRLIAPGATMYPIPWTPHHSLVARRAASLGLKVRPRATRPRPSPPQGSPQEPSGHTSAAAPPWLGSCGHQDSVTKAEM